MGRRLIWGHKWQTGEEPWAQILLRRACLEDLSYSSTVPGDRASDGSIKTQAGSIMK